MDLRKRFAFRDRKGFALILVFSLASIVLLLALSLVSLTQVESASSRYDQGLRIARANARLALQMALGDLQEFAGPDQRITATADGNRATLDEDFNDPSVVGTSNVHQPHWTGVWNVDNTTDTPVWLVTRPLDEDYDLTSDSQGVNPFVAGLNTSNDLVKLVGESSAKPKNSGADQALHDISVPKIAVESENIVGMDDAVEAAIGHYAYWVGDNGVKASYLIKDSVPDVMHDGYSIDDDADDLTENIGTPDQIRLLQMLGHRNHWEVNSRQLVATDARLGSIVSDLALREGYRAAGSSTVRSMLDGLTYNDVLLRFHDAASLSRGLIVDTQRGGLRRDLSVMESVDFPDSSPDVFVNDTLMPYLNVGALVSTSPSALTRVYEIGAKETIFGVGSPRPSIAPVLTGMKLAVRLIAPNLAPITETSAVMGQLEFSVRLMNPYTSAIETTTPLVFRLKNPHVVSGSDGFRATYTRASVTFLTSDPVGFSDLMSGVTEFEITASGLGEQWNPGETRSFVGVFDPLDGTNRVFLAESSAPPAEDPLKFYTSGLPDYTSIASPSSGRGDILDRIYFDIPAWTPEFDLEIDGEVVSEFRVNTGAYLSMNTSPVPVKNTEFPNIAYVWEVGDPRDSDVDWVGFDPRSGALNPGVLSSMFDSDYKLPGNANSVEHFFEASAVGLLGHNDIGSPDVTHNIPIFELPRQEFLSLGALQMAEFPSGVRGHLGMSLADAVTAGAAGSINDVFDRYFLSTVPQVDSTNWEVGDALPNGRMTVAGNPPINDVINIDSAKHLYLNGAFNINSTSVEAWASLLKSIRLGAWEYADGAGGATELNLAGSNQFLRFSQSAEETWQGVYATDADDVTRERFRKGLRSFSDAEIELFALKIVKGIRARRQGTIAPMGPFVSLQDFIDSGVIKTAISEAGLNGTNTETYTSSYLTQQDVLTAIAPFLSARSDTFVIRAYGDAVNPFDDQEILARAYCEAIVQRTHAKHSTDPNSGDVMAPTGEAPGEFGRQFKVIAFRWMTGDEL
jgi:hypothetical protein